MPRNLLRFIPIASYGVGPGLCDQAVLVTYFRNFLQGEHIKGSFAIVRKYHIPIEGSRIIMLRGELVRAGGCSTLRSCPSS